MNPYQRTTVDEPHWDLSSLAGDEHTVRFRGEFVTVDAVGRTIPLRFRSVEPVVPFVIATNAEEVHPEDFGGRLPIAVGSSTITPVRLRVPAVQTTAQSIDATFTGSIALENTDHLPATGTFALLINGEEVECDGSDQAARTANITARGQNGTTAVAHPAGAITVELEEETVLGVSAARIQSVDRLLIFNPFAGSWAEVGVPFEVRLDDTEAIPGRQITTIRILQDDLRVLLREFFVESRVTVQPEYEGDTAGSPGTFTTVRVEGGTESTYSLGTTFGRGEVDLVSTPRSKLYNSTTDPREGYRRTFVASDFSGFAAQGG